VGAGSHRSASWGNRAAARRRGGRWPSGRRCRSGSGPPAGHPPGLRRRPRSRGRRSGRLRGGRLGAPILGTSHPRSGDGRRRPHVAALSQRPGLGRGGVRSWPAHGWSGSHDIEACPAPSGRSRGRDGAGYGSPPAPALTLGCLDPGRPGTRLAAVTGSGERLAAGAASALGIAQACGDERVPTHGGGSWSSRLAALAVAELLAAGGTAVTGSDEGVLTADAVAGPAAPEHERRSLTHGAGPG
jgi:hypothetical protein